MDTDLAPRRPFTRYVAIGDSQTEGVGDPDGMGGYRGWADRFAELLGAACPDVLYANLAVRGRRIEAIRAEQLDAALALGPDLVTVLAGMNDLIRPGASRAGLLRELDTVFGALVGSGATVVSFTFPDLGAVIPPARPLSARIYALNDDVRELAEEHGVVLVDIETAEVTGNPAVWAEDRLHLNPLGHDLLARAVADALALPGSDGSWREPLPFPERGYARSMGAGLRWATRYLLPWAARRAAGRSAGDGVTAKRPDLLPVLP
ncbi:SGNH/GDSL hydrolase family protein [Nocardia arizonensis]|uniref:SGNH/GDSL hydrolase family protein n=1 Tax=Nocardia arizonensis TaxID=1141647 RepID=UPI0006D032A1|nr:SGNH/GDSL hydrolase family protein [Nocardia arizonensis]